jgi:hypothetical protein
VGLTSNDNYTIFHIGSYEKDGERLWTKLEVRRRLGIKQRSTINEHCAFLGYDNPLTSEQFKQLLAMNSFLRLGGGGEYYSRKNFMKLRNQGLINSELQRLGIDLDQEFKRMVDK